jgi:hypothetical protein
MDEYGEYANLPVFNAHGSIVGYVGGEVPESGNSCEFNRLDNEGFTYCASATEVVRLMAENAKLYTQLADVTESMGRVEERCAKLRKLVVDICSCARDNPCSRCYFVSGKCEFCDRMRELGFEVDG